MKKIRISFLTILLVVSFSTFAQSKIAHVNSQEIIALMPATKAAQAEIQGMEETYTKELEAMQKDILEKQQKYASEENSVSLELNQTRGAELQDQSQRVQAYYNEIQKEIQRKNFDLLKPISEELMKAVNTIADRLGFEYVFESPMQGLLVSNGTDITDEVKKELGL
jgi:outer membrane protein